VIRMYYYFAYLYFERISQWKPMNYYITDTQDFANITRVKLLLSKF